MKILRIFITLTLCLAYYNAVAGECVVSSASGFIKKAGAVANDGDCRTDSAKYRNKYESYRGTSIIFHVIRFENSLEIGGSIPCLTGYKDNPLIIMADSDQQVTFSSVSPICINGKGGSVILDNFQFKSGGLTITSSENAVLNSTFLNGTVKIEGDSNKIVSGKILDSPNNGLEISGNDNRILKTVIENSVGYGIRVTGENSKILECKIIKNGKNGIFIEENTALISKTEFNGNIGGEISAETAAIKAPEKIVGIDSGGKWIVSGNLPKGSYNLNKIKIELFVKDGPFLAETDNIEPATLGFVFSISKQDIASPIFTATAVDYENNETSEFSTTPDLLNQNDWDNDGILNDQEDYNRNGTVDFGETDPKNIDTDGDGLTDGEERLHTGRIKELLDKGFKFAELSNLDPVNPDSDSDCLNDGLELGVSSGSGETTGDGAVSAIKALISGETSSEPDYINKLSPYCRAILKSHNVLSASKFDSDTAEITDPTNSDTDSDALKDGEEDWNFNGKRDKSDNPQLYLETDPNNPDSDGDSILDGEEGDQNKNAVLDEYETDPLFKDTDGDGVSDYIEIARLGSLPNACDTDKDGLPDGIEAGVINPNQDKPSCAGLQTAGTNFASIGVLSTIKADSDGDGLKDGEEEDLNYNGWLDFGETDPTVTDTDDDGISDYVEKTLDADSDGSQDTDISLFENGKKCSPPKFAWDLDCDSIPNTRDLDSDNDGCSDKEEWGKDKNGDGVSDAWQMNTASCEATGGSAGGSVGASTPPASGSTTAPVISGSTSVAKTETWGSDGGASCSLIKDSHSHSAPFSCISILIILLLIYPVRFIFRI